MTDGERIAEFEAQLAEANVATATRPQTQQLAPLAAASIATEAQAGDCLNCGRPLPGDGDCYGCAADIAWADLNAAIERAEAAEAHVGGLREFAGKLWERLNRRRCYLIERKIAGRASKAERLELDELQALADENIRIFAPLPIEALEKYMREHGIEIPEQPAESEETK